MSGREFESGKARIKREASEWVVKQSFGFSAEEQDAFFEWLSQDSEHANMYASRKKAWTHLDILAAWRPEHSRNPNPDLLDVAHPPKKRHLYAGLRWAVALAAVWAVALGIWEFASVTGPKRLAEGVYAETYERHVLEDGSVVELNRGSQATVEFTENARHVHLESGEAYFTVAKDAARPFVVFADGVSVRAVGTVFNVQLDGGFVDVLVTEGRVLVAPDAPLDSALREEAPRAFVRELGPGQRSVVPTDKTKESSSVETLSDSEMDDRLIWLKQVIRFTDTPLSKIVLELNRRNQRKIVIEDSSIENLKMDVVIRPNNIDYFVEVLDLTMNIESELMGESVIVLRSKKSL